jgi:hypothetical protein
LPTSESSTTRPCSTDLPASETEDERESLVDGAELVDFERPAERPSRCGSTTVVCSTRTRVSCPSSVIVRRKLAARALVEMDATSTVLRSKNSSAWTTTA